MGAQSCLDFYVDANNLNSGPHARLVSALSYPLDDLPNPCSFILLMN